MYQHADRKDLQRFHKSSWHPSTSVWLDQFKNNLESIIPLWERLFTGGKQHSYQNYLESVSPEIQVEVNIMHLKNLKATFQTFQSSESYIFVTVKFENDWTNLALLLRVFPEKASTPWKNKTASHTL